MQRTRWGESLRNRRLAADLTQRQIADAVGVSQSVIAKIENGYRVPRDGLRVRLARVLGVEPHVLFPYELLDDDGPDEGADDDEELAAVAS